jgi:hypothetical protein
MTTDPLTGRCLCGATAYRLTAELLDFQYCHCSRCRRFTGSAHAANVFVGPDAFEWTAGGDSVGSFHLDAEPGFPTGFCRTCGSSMPAKSSTGRYWVVPAGTLDGDPGLRPARNIFWGSRAPWFTCVSELERHEELPPRG